MKRIYLIFIILGNILNAYSQYEPNWESLSKHNPVPEWLQDAKFGIYCHWGVYSVPAYGNEQYFYYMHADSIADNSFLMGCSERHRQLYGKLEDFGYHDFIPRFKAERFDPAAWARLFRESGARFAGLVAEHHDGFSMWNSKQTPFCAAKMGPKRDIVGELGKAIREEGMKFFTSLHHENNYYYVKVRKGWKAYNKKYEKLYGCLMNRQEWYKMWLAKCVEVIDNYSPDIIYFDAWMDSIPLNLKQQFAAHYFNHAQQKGQEVTFTYKNKDFPRNVAMLDHEMANPDKIDPTPWLCDYTIADGYHKSWGYVKGMQLLSHHKIIHKLIEVVANNGVLLLNLSPKSDGTFPQDQQDVVANVGVWLWSYGESIYETRPYAVSGETLDGGAKVFYTKKKDGKHIYAIFTEMPPKGKPILLSKLNKADMGGKPVKATILSVKKNYDCSFIETNGGIILTIPENARRPSDVAQVVRFDIE